MGLGVLRCDGGGKDGAFSVSVVPGSSLKRLRNDVGKRGAAGFTVDAIEDGSIGPPSSSSSAGGLIIRLLMVSNSHKSSSCSTILSRLSVKLVVNAWQGVS